MTLDAAEALTLDQVEREVGLPAPVVTRLVHEGTIPAPVGQRWRRIDMAEALIREVRFRQPHGSRDWLIGVIYDEVMHFSRSHGHALICPDDTGRETDGTTFPLGKAVSDLRAAHRMGLVAATWIDKFSEIADWQWDTADAVWLRRWKHVSTSDTLDASSRRWLQRQHATIDSLPQWRVDLIQSSAGQVPPPQEASRVDAFVDAANLWIAEENRRRKAGEPKASAADMTSRSVVTVTDPDSPSGEKEVPVGKMAVYYRRRRRGLEGGGHRLSDDEVVTIESIPGWSWGGPSVGRNLTMAVWAARKVAAAVQCWLAENKSLTLADLAFTQRASLVTDDGEEEVVLLGIRVRSYQRRRDVLAPEVTAVLDGLDGWSWEPPTRNGILTKPPQGKMPRRETVRR